MCIVKVLPATYEVSLHGEESRTSRLGTEVPKVLAYQYHGRACLRNLQLNDEANVTGARWRAVGTSPHRVLPSVTFPHQTYRCVL